MSVLFAGQVFLFEFKVVELSPQGRALQQIKTLRPAASHQSLNSGLRLPMLAIMDSCRSLLSSMAAFQVAT